jgi:hypothetical protein
LLSESKIIQQYEYHTLNNLDSALENLNKLNPNHPNATIAGASDGEKKSERCGGEILQAGIGDKLVSTIVATTTALHIPTASLKTKSALSLVQTASKHTSDKNKFLLFVPGYVIAVLTVWFCTYS